MKKGLMACAVAATFLFTGCMKTSAWTEESTALMSEYIADTILKYDETYDGKLEEIKTESKEEVEQPKQEVEQQKEEVTQSQTQSENDKKEPVVSEESQEVIQPSINDILAIDGIAIEQKTIKLVGQYPEKESNVAINLVANQGNKFLLVFFELTNTTEQTIKIDLLNRKMNYALKGEGKTYSAVMSFLEDDIQFLQSSLEPGKTITAMVAFDVKETIDLDKLSLQVGDSSNKTELVIGN